MDNLKQLTVEQKDILEKSISILYTCKNESGNLQEKEVIKHKEKFYRITAINKKVVEFIEV